MIKGLALNTLVFCLFQSASVGAQNYEPTRPRSVVQATSVRAQINPLPSSGSLSTSPATPSTIPQPLAPVVPVPAPAIAHEKVRTKLAEAKRLFRTRPVLTGLSASQLYFVRIAVLKPDSQLIDFITVPKQTFLTRGTEVELTSIEGVPLRLRIDRTNYVNTAVTVFDRNGKSYIPLLVEYPIEKYGSYKETAYYTSAHKAVISAETVHAGKGYVRNTIELAARRLAQKGVKIPQDIMNVAERLCIVEHVDHERFNTESRSALFEEVFSLYGLNETDTYRYSVSSAGAGGMVQMIPPTYQMVRRMHPEAGLIPDFVTGMRNHANAAEAMLLYINDTWQDLSQSMDVNFAISSGWATKAEILAAGYNSNPAKLPSYIRRGGSAWRSLIPRETQMYLQIQRSLDSFISPSTIQSARKGY
jgi:hypothetical protein